MIQKNNFKLHSRVTLMLFVIAVVSMVTYATLMMVFVEKLESAMLTTLVGHEIDELVTDLAQDPEAKMPQTASVKAYLLSRENRNPIPGFLKQLSSNIHDNVRDGERIYEVAILDLGSDRIYVTFDTTDMAGHKSTLLALHVGGGLFAAFMLVVSGFWLFRKFLLPVSHLAEEIANIDPNDRNIRLEKKYQGYEVGLIVQSFDGFMGRLDDFVEREQSFTAAVSHELRTPVSVIATATDLLELKGIADNQQGAVRRIKESAGYMEKVIESLLFFARNTHDAVEKTLPEIKLDSVLLNILNQYEEQVSGKKLALRYKFKSRISVRISENHLEIILGNLVRNAIVNTNAGEVKVTLFENGFSVSDTGHGIDASEIDLIVQRNYHNPDSLGAGLGLYLVKNICDIYGLTLEIESTVGEGSEFFVIFPESMVS